MTINVNLNDQQVSDIVFALRDAAGGWTRSDPSGTHSQKTATRYRQMARQLLAAHEDHNRNPHIPVVITN